MQRLFFDEILEILSNKRLRISNSFDIFVFDTEHETICINNLGECYDDTSSLLLTNDKLIVFVQEI